MVAVFNFGGQYAHLIARRIRELGVKSELISPTVTSQRLLKLSPQALILSGSPYSCYQKNAPKLDKKIYGLKLPILGICYGQQLIAYQLDGKVSNHESKQFGKETLEVSKSPLFERLTHSETVWFSHGDQVDKLPTGFEVIASTKGARIAAMQNIGKNFYGIQFHPEVSHTPKGNIILSNFLFNIAKAKKDWNLGKIKGQLVKNLQDQIGEGSVVMALSGGVDSLVAATLIKRAVGSKLYSVFIDTGLLRKYDVDDLKKISSWTDFKIKIVDAKSRFLKALENITDPEKKRQIISKLYFQILEGEAKKIGKNLATSDAVKFLGQGTIYPDRVESAQPSKHAHKIKSHHNVTLPHDLKLKIIEPLAEFYKDEVRKLGKLLKIPEEFLARHPFPGPGLAIRILGEVTEKRLEILRESDDIFISELRNNNIYKEAGQALAALLPIKSVGVMGDARTYQYIITLRCVDTQDFMTADWTKIPNTVLEKVSSRIVNEVRGVNRVVHDITQKPPATIEYE